MEIAHVRNQLRSAIQKARDRAQARRQRMAESESAYAHFLDTVAVPVARQFANALKVEGYAFNVATPGGGLRLASDRARDDYVDIALDTSGDRPQVLARISRTRGSRTFDNERPVKPGAGPEAISEEEFLAFLIEAFEPWLER